MATTYNPAPQLPFLVYSIDLEQLAEVRFVKGNNPAVSLNEVWLNGKLIFPLSASTIVQYATTIGQTVYDRIYLPDTEITTSKIVDAIALKMGVTKDYSSMSQYVKKVSVGKKVTTLNLADTSGIDELTFHQDCRPTKIVSLYVGSGVTEIEIPDSVVDMGYGDQANMSSWGCLTNKGITITLPNGLKSFCYNNPIQGANMGRLTINNFPSNLTKVAHLLGINLNQEVLDLSSADASDSYIRRMGGFKVLKLSVPTGTTKANEHPWMISDLDDVEVVVYEQKNTSASFGGVGILEGWFENCPKLKTVILPNCRRLYSGTNTEMVDASFSGSPVETIYTDATISTDDLAILSGKGITVKATSQLPTNLEQYV